MKNSLSAVQRWPLKLRDPKIDCFNALDNSDSLLSSKISGKKIYNVNIRRVQTIGVGKSHERTQTMVIRTYSILKEATGRRKRHVPPCFSPPTARIPSTDVDEDVDE